MRPHLIFAADHAGYLLKNSLMHQVQQQGFPCRDLGVSTPEPVDYPDIAVQLAETLHVLSSKAIGVLICGSGIGVSIMANRYSHIRAALCMTPQMAELARRHNDANVLVLGARVISSEMALECLETFLQVPFEGGRHQARVDKLSQITDK
jgi:ribose 5-phosphate isomerase B